MAVNPFYSFIKYAVDQKLTPKGSKVHFDQNNRGIDYLYLEIPYDKDNRFGITKHHISFYAPDEKYRQYHYTADFGSNRLHVYFDMNDRIVLAPTMHLMEKGEIKQVIDIQSHESAYMGLAQQLCEEPIKQLRGIWQEFLSKVMKHYKLNEEYLCQLSVDFEKNKEKYLTALNEQFMHIDNLILYTDKPRYWRKIKAHYERLGLDLSLDKPSLKEGVTLVTPELEEENEVFYVLHRDLKKSSKKDKISSIKRELIKNSLVLLQLENDFDDSSINKFIETYHNLNKLSIEAEFYLSQIKPIEHIQLAKLLRSVHELGQKKSLQLIKESKFDLAEKFKPFFATSFSDLYKTALQNNNSALFDFLIKNELVFIHQSPVMVKDKKYDSFMDYCMKTAGSNKTTKDIFRVLLKYQTAILSIDKNTKLPFAAILQLNQQHPLAAVFSEFKQSYNGDPKFLKKLNKILENIVSSIANEELKVKVLSLIDKNKQSIDKLEQTPFEKSIVSNIEKWGLILEHDRLSQLRRAINSEPEFLALGHQIKYASEKYKKFIEHIKSTQKKEEHKNPLIEYLYEYLSLLVKYDIVPPYETLKTYCLYSLFIEMQINTQGYEYISKLDEIGKINFDKNTFQDLSPHMCKGMFGFQEKNKKLNKEMLQIQKKPLTYSNLIATFDGLINEYCVNFMEMTTESGKKIKDLKCIHSLFKTSLSEKREDDQIIQSSGDYKDLVHDLIEQFKKMKNSKVKEDGTLSESEIKECSQLLIELKNLGKELLKRLFIQVDKEVISQMHDIYESSVKL